MPSPSQPPAPPGRPAADVAEPKRAEIGLCLLLAAADGEISDAEIGALSARIGELFGEQVSPFVMKAVLEEEMAALDELGPDDYLTTLATRLPIADRDRVLCSALRVAHADGLAREEHDAFEEAAAALGIGERRSAQMLAGAAVHDSGLPAWSSDAPPDSQGAPPDPTRTASR